MRMPTDYERLCRDLSALTDGISYETANLANASALLWQFLPEINWAGFYKMEGGKLILGPFQGKPACIVIPVGKGVCGTAVAEDKTQLVADVHTFPGHIACSSLSKSEIVVPVFNAENEVVGVLDIDSDELFTFDEIDAKYLEEIVKLLNN